MNLTRRRFLHAVAASSAGAVAFTGCAAPGSLHEFRIASPARLPEDLANSQDNWYATLCPQCEAGLGVIARVVSGRATKLEGNPDYPVNAGKLSAQGQAGVQELYHPDRITGPLRRSGERFTGQLEQVTWEQGLDDLVNRLRSAVGGPANSTLVVTDSLRGHRALVVDRFARSLNAQYATFEPLERKATIREVMRRVFGFDRLPAFDVANARYILSFGADFLGTWLSPVYYSRGYGTFRQGRPGQRGHLVQVEPRMSQTAAAADQWIPARPGSEGILALGIAQTLAAEGATDAAALSALTGGAGAAALDAFRPDRTADQTGVPADRVVALARDLAARRPALVLGGDSAGAHPNGLASLQAIYSLNLLLGSVGVPGGILPNPAPPFADLPAPVRTSFADWQRLAESMRSGAVQLAMVHGANPVYGLPSLGLRDALARVPFVVSFSSFLDETTALADLVLPDHHYLEAWGDDVPDPGPGFATVGIQQPIVTPQHDTRSFMDLLLVVASELGGAARSALPWNSFREVLLDAASQLQALNRGSVTAPSPEAFWPRLLQQGGWWDNQTTGTATPPGQPPAALPAGIAPPVAAASQDFPYHLHVFSSSALREGQYAHLPWLQALPDPMTTAVWSTWAELNPETARSLGIGDGDHVIVESSVGSVQVPVYVFPAIRPDVVAMPLGQGHTDYTRYAANRGVNPLAILAPEVDAETGAHAWSATRVRVRKADRGPSRVPKFEGNVPPVLPESLPLIQRRSEGV